MKTEQLDFLEAVEVLNKDRCDGIAPQHWDDRNKGGGCYVVENNTLGYSCYPDSKIDLSMKLSLSTLLGKWKLIGVKPRTEQRTIEYWLTIGKDGNERLSKEKPSLLGKDYIQQVIPLSTTYTYTLPEEE